MRKKIFFLKAIEKKWLFKKNSLVEKMSQIGDVHIFILKEKKAKCSKKEADFLRIPRGSIVWIREVLIKISNIDCIFARTILSLKNSKSHWSKIRNLKENPLANLLYKKPKIYRSHFCFFELKKNDFLLKRIQEYRNLVNIHQNARILSRSSVFWKGTEPLLLKECFLENFWRLMNSKY